MKKNILKFVFILEIIFLILWLTVGFVFYILTLIFLAPVHGRYIIQMEYFEYIFYCIMLSIVYFSMIFVLIRYMQDTKTLIKKSNN